MKSSRRTRGAARAGDRRNRVVLLVVLLGACAFAFYHAGRQLWGEHHRRQAEHALAGRDWGRAEASLQRCFSIWPGKAELHLLAARLARRQKNFAEAQRRLSLCWEAGGLKEAIALEQRLIQVQNGDPSGDAELRQYCLDHPQTAESTLILEALIEGRLAKVDAAGAQAYVDLWRAAPRGSADEVQACMWQALIHELNKAPDLARAEYRRAIQLAPENLEPRLALAALVADDRPAEAAEQLNILEQHAPNNPEVLLVSARVHHNLGRLEEAAQKLDRLLEQSPDHVDALAARGRLALEMRQTESAGQWLRRAERLAPKHRDVLLSMIAYHRAAGNLEEAQRYEKRMAEVGEEIEQYVKSRLEHLRARSPAGVHGPAPPGQE
jgi:tetratricopeptide (TPR) repeat protein